MIVPFIVGCAQKGLELEYQFKQDDVLTYNLGMEMTMRFSEDNKTEMKTNMKLVQEVNSVDENDTAEMYVSISDATVEMTMSGPIGEQPMPVQALAEELNKLRYSMRVMKNGKVLSVKMLETVPGREHTQQQVQQMLRQISLTFPDRAIEKGDVWSHTIDLPLELKGISLNQKMKTDYQFVGIEKIQGYNCAKIKYQTTVTLSSTVPQKEQSLPMSLTGRGGGVTYFAYEQGMLVKSDVEAITTTEIGEEIQTESQVKTNMELSQ